MTNEESMTLHNRIGNIELTLTMMAVQLDAMGDKETKEKMSLLMESFLQVAKASGSEVYAQLTSLQQEAALNAVEAEGAANGH